MRKSISPSISRRAASMQIGEGVPLRGLKVAAQEFKIETSGKLPLLDVFSLPRTLVVMYPATNLWT